MDILSKIKKGVIDNVKQDIKDCIIDVDQETKDFLRVFPKLKNFREVFRAAEKFYLLDDLSYKECFGIDTIDRLEDMRGNPIDDYHEWVMRGNDPSEAIDVEEDPDEYIERVQDMIDKEKAGPLSELLDI